MPELCAKCGYDLGGLDPITGETKCPECAHTYTGARPVAHWLYRNRWLVGIGWCVCVAVAWAIIIARENNGWGQVGLVVFFSAAPAVLAGVLASISTVIGGRMLTPMGIRQANNLRWGTLLVDALLVALGTGAAAVAACYVSGGVAMSFWGAGGC